MPTSGHCGRCAIARCRRAPSTSADRKPSRCAPSRRFSGNGSEKSRSSPAPRRRPHGSPTPARPNVCSVRPAFRSQRWWIGSPTGWRATCRAWASRRSSRCAMASIEDALVTEVLTPAGVAAALELSAAAGWNQTAEDWKIFLAHGRVTGVLAAGRRLVAIAALQAQGRTPMLDATPAGAAVYRPLGFREVFSIRRWQGKGREGPPSRIRRATAADLPMLTEHDAKAFGAPRRFLLASFLARLGTRALVTDRGFVVRRSGLRADQIGPLVAQDEAS